MSAALASHPDTSSSTHPELSLGSLASGFSTPGTRHLRIPSISSRSTAPSSAPLATPSPPTASVFSRRNSEGLNRLTRDDDPDEEADLLDTPAVDKKRYGQDVETPMRGKRGGVRASAVGNTKGTTTLTLRDQEKHIDNLKKENFNIKLRVHFLEERLAQLAPDQIDAALKQNINLKIEVQQRNMELKKLKKLVLQLERELESQQQQGSSSTTTNRDLEDRLEEREREIRELRRLRASQGDENDDVVRELEMHNAQLEDELEGVRELLQDNMDEIERLKDLLEHHQHDDSLNSPSASSSESRTRLKQRISELEDELAEMHHKLQDQAEFLSQRDDDKEDLLDLVDTLKLQIDEISRKRETDSLERSHSRAMILEEREEREAVEDDLNTMRDRVAALLIEVQQKEDEVDEKNTEIEELVKEHKRIVEVVEDEWRGEVEEARMQSEELKDVLAERETEVRDLRLNISEFESRNNDLRAEFEIALNDLEVQAETKDAQIDAMRVTIDKLGEDIYILEDENDKIKEEAERMREDDMVERERLEALSAALKEKLGQVRAELQETTDIYESCHRELHQHKLLQEDLTRQINELSSQLDQLQTSHQRTLDDLSRKHADEVRKSKLALESKESTLQNTLYELNRLQSLYSQRENDLHAVQSTLEGLEEESKRRGEVDTTTRFSLQLELDRFKRDLERVEDELARTRKTLDSTQQQTLSKDSQIDKLHHENRDLASQLAAQTQSRLNVSGKLDLELGEMRKVREEMEGYKGRVGELEERLGREERVGVGKENMYRDQLTERNTLLLTIYQYMDKILGVDKLPKKGNAGETKPYTNFNVFHDNLITRLKALSQIQLDFDKRCKEVEGRYVDKLNEIKRQLEVRWKQIDRFENGVKGFVDVKAGWRRKFIMKEGELEVLKTSNNELTTQLKKLSSSSPPSAESNSEIKSLQARAINAERRLNNAQNQLLGMEEKVAGMNRRSEVVDGKWDVRVKEYEVRLKSAEERVKRERQGSKERVGELENNIRNLQSQLEKALKRERKLEDVVGSNKPS